MEFDDMLLLENSGEPPQSCNTIGDLSAEAINPDIILSWEAPSGIAPDKYLVYCNGLFLKATTVPTCTHANVIHNVYYYCVEALFADGCTSDLTCIETVTPCNIDIELTLRSYEDGVILTWLPKLENVTYKVFRNEELMKEVAENSYKELLTYDEKYCYTVVAVCPADLESEPSNEECAGGVGIDELEDALKIYPNPTTGELIIKNYELKINNVEIFDVFGRCVLRHCEQSEAIQKINISFLPAGMYFMRITTETDSFIRKVVKQ
jgi:hypothetical protein